MLTSRFYVDRMNWIARLLAVREEVEAAVKVRYKSPEFFCRFRAQSTGREVEPTSGSVA
ncbi:MAG: hypothetical protein H5U06_05060 [Candidatus Aminicenantes bacterium]|nr:hypothetical protein [Candidatus Aminicenantes bacterium]